MCVFYTAIGNKYLVKPRSTPQEGAQTGGGVSTCYKWNQNWILAFFAVLRREIEFPSVNRKKYRPEKKERKKKKKRKRKKESFFLPSSLPPNFPFFFPRDNFWRNSTFPPPKKKRERKERNWQIIALVVFSPSIFPSFLAIKQVYHVQTLKKRGDNLLSLYL